jgi:hypothetical protein
MQRLQGRVNHPYSPGNCPGLPACDALYFLTLHSVFILKNSVLNMFAQASESFRH